MQARWLRLTVRGSRTPTTRKQKLSGRFLRNDGCPGRASRKAAVTSLFIRTPIRSQTNRKFYAPVSLLPENVVYRGGSDWDQLFALDRQNALLRNFAATVDGKYQTLGAKDGLYNLENFFGIDPDLKALVAHLTEREVDSLRRGGHDLRKLHAAFAAAKTTKGRPTVILAKTKKG